MFFTRSFKRILQVRRTRLGRLLLWSCQGNTRLFGFRAGFSSSSLFASTRRHSVTTNYNYRGQLATLDVDGPPPAFTFNYDAVGRLTGHTNPPWVGSGGRPTSTEMSPMTAAARSRGRCTTGLCRCSRAAPSPARIATTRWADASHRPWGMALRPGPPAFSTTSGTSSASSKRQPAHRPEP